MYVACDTPSGRVRSVLGGYGNQGSPSLRVGLSCRGIAAADDFDRVAVWVCLPAVDEASGPSINEILQQMQQLLR